MEFFNENNQRLFNDFYFRRKAPILIVDMVLNMTLTFLGDYLLSTYPKFSRKLTLLTF